MLIALSTRGMLAGSLDPVALRTWTTVFVAIVVQALPFLVLGVLVSGAITALVSPTVLDGWTTGDGGTQVEWIMLPDLVNNLNVGGWVFCDAFSGLSPFSGFSTAWARLDGPGDRTHRRPHRLGAHSIRTGAGRSRSVAPMDVAADVARRFLVTRQMLAPARSVEGGSDGVLEVFRRLGSIQFDPLSVAGRNHDLVLHARVAGYDPAWCDALYQRRELFEAYNKGLSLVLTSEFPWFRANLGVSSRRILAEHADVAEQVLERVRAEGPLSALDFERRRGSAVDWFGAPTNVVRAVLEAYAATGVLGLARRDGNRRSYDLIERLLPPGIVARKIPLRE